MPRPIVKRNIFSSRTDAKENAAGPISFRERGFEYLDRRFRASPP
jgi:hypothetical protein